MKKTFSVLLAIIFLSSVVFFSVSCNKNTETETSITTEKTTAADVTTAVTSETTTESSTSDSVETTTETETSESEETTETETATTDSGTVIPADKDFDENNIVFTFAALSDTHIDSTSGVTANKFVSALTQLRERAGKDCESGLGAVFVAGDLINNGHSDRGYYKEITYFADLYESVLDPENVPMVFCIGNHDTLSEWKSYTVEESRLFNSYLDDVYFSTDTDMQALNDLGCRHCVIDNYHVLAITPCTTTPVNYTDEAKEWLDNTLNEITSKNPDQYVIVLTHPMIYDTVYGSTLGKHWYTEDLTDILSKYPQVVTFSGHLHFPLNDPRSIMQTSFTSLGCGSVKYMAIEDGNYLDMASATTMKDRDLFSQGLLVEVDENGNMRFIRMDFYHEEVIGEYWEISHPDENNTHLTKYTKKRGNEENNDPPTPPTNLAYSYITDSTTGTINLKVTFEAGKDDEFVHDYAITLYKDGKAVRNYGILADFYLHSKTSGMKKVFVADLGTISDGTFELEIVSIDSWGARSDPAKITMVIEKNGDPPVTRENAPLSLYADFDFSNGEITEKTGNIKIKNHGAVVEKTNVSFNGKNYLVDALNTSGDNYTLCTFNSIATPGEMKTFAERGFSVEAFFSTDNNGTVQGVICGTQAGGWGLAVNAQYKPYFITGYGTQGKYNPSVISPDTLSKGTLLHVVAVYDVEELTSSIYVNGELKATQSIDPVFCVGSGLTFNYFCLGADITGGLVGGDFQSSNMVILDAKIYEGVLNQDNVSAAYNAAVESLSNS